MRIVKTRNQPNMGTLTKSLKVKVSLSVIWFVISFLIGLVFSSDASPSGELLFFGFIMIALNLPTLLYWLGVWIWGDGYLWRFVCQPFKSVVMPSKVKPESQNYPWRRFFGRILDYWWWTYILAVSLSIIFPELMASKAFNNQAVWSILGTLTFIFIEPIFISAFGTTPTKWMLGIRVYSIDGKNLSFSKAFSRSFQVWANGLAFGIPIINWFTISKAQDYLKENHTTEWDKAVNSAVVITRPHWLGILCLVGLISYFPYTVYRNQQDEDTIKQFETQALEFPQTRRTLLENHLALIGRLLNEQFSPTNLSDKGTFADKRRRISQAQESIEDTLSKLKVNYDDLESMLQLYDLPTGYKTTFLEKYYPAKKEFMERVQALFVIQRAELELYGGMLDLLESSNYVVPQDTILFQDNDKLGQYNKLIVNMKALAQKEQLALDSFSGKATK